MLVLRMSDYSFILYLFEKLMYRLLKHRYEDFFSRGVYVMYFYSPSKIQGFHDMNHEFTKTQLLIDFIENSSLIIF